MFWKITGFPPCRFHVFLSHSSEDKVSLVEPLCEQLKTKGLIPWFDVHDYPCCRASCEALRSEMVRSRHIAYLITEATLHNARGWQALEKAYGGILQDNFAFSGVDLSHVEVPLFFVGKDEPALVRSIWQPLIDKGHFYRPDHGSPPDWAAVAIGHFLEQEKQYAAEIVRGILHDERLLGMLQQQEGMLDRISAVFPS